MKIRTQRNLPTLEYLLNRGLDAMCGLSKKAAYAVHSDPEFDLVLALSARNRGWILEKICSVIQEEHSGTSLIHIHSPLFRNRQVLNPAGDLQVTRSQSKGKSTLERALSRRLPKARAYFFSHHASLRPALAISPHVWHGFKVVFYTHPQDGDWSAAEIPRSLAAADLVIAMNTFARDQLITSGRHPRTVHTVLCGADPGQFQCAPRRGKTVGLCSRFSQRKAPEKVLQVAESMPSFQFVLLGRDWREWGRFSELERLPNFEYLEVPYSEYPWWFSQMKVFFSPSTVEGGPIPLLESMMSNCVPVVSATGFGPDVIHHGSNGFLFNQATPVRELVGFIQKASEMTTDIRSTVAHLTWQRFGKEIVRLLRD